MFFKPFKPVPKPVHPQDAQTLIAAGAQLIDVREADEHARERIAGARLLPLSQIARGAGLEAGSGSTVIYFCRSGARTFSYGKALAAVAAAANCEAFVLEGGIEAWRDSGYTTER